MEERFTSDGILTTENLAHLTAGNARYPYSVRDYAQIFTKNQGTYTNRQPYNGIDQS